MPQEINRAARRSEARKAKNRKTGLAALSLMATSSLISSYISLLRTEPSFAFTAPGDCERLVELELDVSGTRIQDYTLIEDLQDDIDTALIGTDAVCVTITFFATDDNVLNFTYLDTSVPYDDWIHRAADLDMTSTEGNERIFFVNDSVADIVFDFGFESSYAYNTWLQSPINTTLELEVHNINFRNSLVSANVDGGVIFARNYLSIFDSEFYNNQITGVGYGGAIYAGDHAVISNSRFEDNSANFGKGGALAVQIGASISDSYFYSNDSENGGAVWAYGDVSISDSEFESNESENRGGAVFLVYAAYEGGESSVIANTTFTFNSTGINGDGGAVYVNDLTNLGNVFDSSEGNGFALTISSSNFEGNSAGEEGGALSLESYTSITDSIFSDNSAYNGGAIYTSWSSSDLSILDSEFIGNEGRGSGGAVNLRSHNSTLSNLFFENNSASGSGGALILGGDGSAISNSTFIGNTANGQGGAIRVWDGETNSVNRSTFIGNTAEDGGAIRLGWNDGMVSNSTFLENSSRDQGGAIFGPFSNEIFFNTFLDNLSDSDYDADNPKQNLGESLSVSEGYITGNVFAGDADYPQIQFTYSPRFRELYYNLSTGDDFDPDQPDEATNRGNVPIGDLYLDSELRDNGTANSSQTLAITSQQSAAIGFVPLDFTEVLGSPYSDQRGVLRTATNVTAGAFEGAITTNTVVGPTFGPPPAYFVFDVKPTSKKPKPIINVSGWLLMGVSEVYVDGTKVNILRQTSTGLSFRLPVKSKGPVQIRLVGKGLEHKHILNLDGLIRNETVVPGFAANSTKLSRAMKKEIREFVKANAGLSTVTCKGFTSAPATMQDLRLAQGRGQATCDYIKKLNPELEVKVLPGSHTNTPGQKIRRVRIEMQ